jgi:uncharacterized protein YqeY
VPLIDGRDGARSVPCGVRSNEDVTGSDAASIRDALKAAVIQAMKQRDRGALAAYRTALGAIDNAESVPSGTSHQASAMELSAVGAGRTDVPRRLLTEQDMIDIVLQEANERRAAAESLGGTQPDAAQRLRHEASLLQALVVGTGPTPSGEDVTGL